MSPAWANRDWSFWRHVRAFLCWHRWQWWGDTGHYVECEKCGKITWTFVP